MSRWECDTEGCDGRFEDVESAVIYQTVDHECHECKVYGAVVPEGYFVTRHTSDEYTCVEFVRACDADSSAVRIREDVRDAAEADADLNGVVETPRGRDAL